MGLTKKSWNSKRDWFQIFFTKNDSRWCSYSKYDCNYLTKAQKPFVLVIRYLTGPGHLGRQHDYDDDWDSCGVTSESLLQKRKVKSTKNVVTKKVKKPTQGNLIVPNRNDERPDTGHKHSLGVGEKIQAILWIIPRGDFLKNDYKRNKTVPRAFKIPGKAWINENYLQFLYNVKVFFICSFKTLFSYHTQRHCSNRYRHPNI